MQSADYRKALRLMSREENAGKAYPLLVAAMEQGDYRAHYALATWYLFGRHVRKNVRQAVKLLEVASDNGIAEAAFDLAVCYEKGEGVRSDPSKAAALYLRAWRLGDDTAAFELRRMFYWGLGVEKNRLIAKEFATLVGGEGDRVAQ